MNMQVWGFFGIYMRPECMDILKITYFGRFLKKTR